MDSAVWIIIAMIVGAIITRIASAYPLRACASPRSALHRSAPGCQPSGDDPSATLKSLLGGCDPYEGSGRFMWRSQIPALRAVCEHEPNGMYFASLKPIYIELERRFPELYEGLGFHTWGQSLVEVGVFRVADKRVHITPSGRALLETVANARPENSRELPSRC